MRTMHRFAWLPTLCSWAALHGCATSTPSAPYSSGSAGATSVAGSTATSGAPGAGGGANQAGSPAAGGSGAGNGQGGVSSGGASSGGASSGGVSSGGVSSGGVSSGGVSSGGVSSGGADACDTGSGVVAGAPAGSTPVGKYVLTWYSFQDNTPVNSLFSASGNLLTPFVSVAVPFTQIVNCAGETPKPGQTCGKLKYGDKLYVDFLKDRVMPNGMKHTGWVVLDDYCGDGNDDTYCYQDGGDGKTYPNVDLYIGDFVQSGMKPCGDQCTGPAGNGGELFNLSTGNPSAADFINNYGGAAVGTGKCGDRQTARDQQYGPPAGSPFGTSSKPGSLTACWGYDGQGSNVKACGDCMPGITCAK